MTERRAPDTLMIRPCSKPGCRERSREGKAECADHITDRPYVQRIKADLAGMDAQEEQLRKRPTEDTTSLLMQEVMRTCAMLGSVTPERLARERDLGVRAAYHALVSLVRCGLAREGTNRRGCTTFRWLGTPAPR